MQIPEVFLFILAALVVGALTMGGITWAYFLDKRDERPSKSSRVSAQEHAESSPF